MANLPTDVANQALDAAGVDFTMGDIEEGSRAAQVSLRAYRQCLMQLLRGAHWNFARKSAPLTLLADASGNTPNVGTQVPVSQFIYEYEYPVDCMKMRFVPWNFPPSVSGAGVPAGNIQIPNVPQTTGTTGLAQVGQRIRPAKWLETLDYNYPPPAGTINWEVQGVSPQGRIVILTNVQNAQAVYTSLVLYPSVWDALFRGAFVSYLASEIIVPLSKDKKFALSYRPQLIAAVKDKLTQARIADGNEAWATNDIPVDWIQRRRSGGFGFWGWGGQGGGLGGDDWGNFSGWDSCSFSDGSVF
jgi:hypothetical protein